MRLLWSSKQNDCELLHNIRSLLDTGNGRRIIAFADTRYWNGGHCGYRFVETGNLKDCFFTNHDDTEFYLTDQGEFLSREYGKEGMCQYYFRRFRDNVPRNFLSLMIETQKNGTFGNEFINRFTVPFGNEVRELLKELLS